MGHYKKQIEDALETMHEDLQSPQEPSSILDMAREASPLDVANEASTEDMLKERGENYGDFATQAVLSQTLKNTIMQHYFQVHGGNKAQPLPAYMVEAISMICHKLARIANGNVTYSDSWQDIVGYAQLVINELEKNK